jgi:Cu/Zn superoxide dismutase
MSRTRIAVGVCVATIATASLASVSNAASPKFTAAMSGAQEVPTKGDAKTTGKATITATGKKLCYTIVVKNLSGVPQAGHIHSGVKGKAGPVFVTLFAKPKAPKKGKLSGCVSATASQIKAISAKPSAYYVNVHTKEYPNGALRGQLKKS